MTCSLDVRARTRVRARSPTSAPSYGLFIDGEFVDGNGCDVKTVNPATEEVLAEVGTASSDDVDRAVAAARRAYERRLGPDAAAPSGPSTCSASRGSSQERARELAVLETLDNGKPIRESRDVDVPRRQRTSSTTRAGPTSWSTRGSARPRSRSAWSAR